MSAFLGPIHSWLFNKIKFQDDLVKHLINNVVIDDDLKKEIFNVNERFGSLEDGDLADIIDENNIHGWLQERINIVENHFAYFVTVVTNNNPNKMIDICDAVYDFGKKNKIENDYSIKDVFEYLDNLLLNGMPCDRVNEIISEDENSIKWKQTVDIHAKYWQAMDGNANNYYLIRESLTKGILEGSKINYSKLNDQIFEIRKEV